MSKQATIRVPQLRVLKALQPRGGKHGPLLSRTTLAEKAGFNPGTGTINAALHGRSSKYGNFLGLLAQGLVKKEILDVDGVKENCYQITPKGVKALKALDKDRAKALKTHRDKSLCVNARYA